MTHREGEQQPRRADDDPFSEWALLIHRSVYSSDGKKVGNLRKVISDYMVIKAGLLILNKYFVPKSFAESVHRKGRIRLRITRQELHSRYSYAKMSNLLTAIEGIPEVHVAPMPLHDRLQMLRFGTTRNRLAAGVAFISGLLFLLSGYKANLEFYRVIIHQLSLINGIHSFLDIVILPVGILALLSQLGGFAVLMGAGFFAANRVNIGKFLVMLGTGQGLFTIISRLTLEAWLGHTWAVNNYVLWLTSTAAGLGIIFAILSQSISKGKGKSISYRAFEIMFGRMVKKIKW